MSVIHPCEECLVVLVIRQAWVRVVQGLLISFCHSEVKDVISQLV